MEICTKKLQMEYLLTFLIHDGRLAEWEDDVNNEIFFFKGMTSNLSKDLT